MSLNNSKKDFHEALAAIVDFATVSGNHITKDIVHTYFKDFIRDESMYESIYKYLSDAKITIEGYESSDTPKVSDTDESSDVNKSASPFIHETKDSPEASAFFEMYLDDLKTLDIHNTHPEILIEQLIQGDTSVVSTLTEHYLPLVLTLTESFEHRGLSHSDLVAEGNLSLYEAILTYNATNSTREDFEAYLASQIKEALSNATNAEIGSYRVSNHLTDQVNALNDAATELAKDLGREATLEELCRHLSLSEDEVKELMRISIQALTINE